MKKKLLGQEEGVVTSTNRVLEKLSLNEIRASLHKLPKECNKECAKACTKERRLKTSRKIEVRDKVKEIPLPISPIRKEALSNTKAALETPQFGD